MAGGSVRRVFSFNSNLQLSSAQEPKSFIPFIHTTHYYLLYLPRKRKVCQARCAFGSLLKRDFCAFDDEEEMD